MTIVRSGLAGVLLALLLLAPGISGAYSPDEARAILVTRPEAASSGAERLVLATQRQIQPGSQGELESIDHILWMVGPAGPRDRGRMIWTHRIGIERVWMLSGRVHHNDGRSEAIPPDSARTRPCAAAGPEGYPGIADFVVAPPPLSPGDVVEVMVRGTIAPIFILKHYIGEHHFGGPDSTIESELRITFPNELPLRTWWFGAVPGPRERTAGGTTTATWLLGHLPPEPPYDRTIAACVTSQGPDTLGPPVLRFGFPDEWESIVQARRRLWRIALSKVPDPLVTAAAEIMNNYADPAGRADAAVEWVGGHVAELEIPAARMWFEPADLGEVLDRGAAIPRDRAAILIWLLRRLGVPADAAMVGSSAPMIEEVPLPHQLDAWVVQSRPPAGGERWIDLRLDARNRPPLPAGKALVWTAQPEEPIIIPFPGTEEGER